MYQKLKNYQLCKCTESTPQGAKKFLLFRVLQPLKDLRDPLKYLQEQEGSLVHLCEREPAGERVRSIFAGQIIKSHLSTSA